MKEILLGLPFVVLIIFAFWMVEIFPIIGWIILYTSLAGIGLFLCWCFGVLAEVIWIELHR